MTTRLASRFQARADRYANLDRETRAFHRPLQLRADDNGDFDFLGYSCLFGVSYEVEDWLGVYTETFDAGAFTKTLAERDDIRLLINHADLPLARTKSGTLILIQDTVGLRNEAKLQGVDPDVQRIAPKMQRGDLDGMSILFRAVRQEWDEDYTDRHVIEARLYDSSIVTFPASTTTWATLRSAEVIRAMADGNARRMLQELRSAGAPQRSEVIAAAVRSLEIVNGLFTRAEADGSDEAEEEAEEISDLTVLKSQLDAATLLVDQMLAEEAEDTPDTGTEGADASQRDTPATIPLDIARRQAELLQLASR